jgi:hypothetical protein
MLLNNYGVAAENAYLQALRLIDLNKEPKN